MTNHQSMRRRSSSRQVNYVRHLAHYAGVYGALEAVLVLALWLELSVSVILFCGEVVALLIHTRPTSRELETLSRAF